MGQHTCQCGGGHCSTHEANEKKRWILPVVSIIIWFGCWALQNTVSVFDEKEWLRLTAFFVAWLPVAFPVMVEAWKAMKERDFFNEFTLMLLASAGAFYIGEYPEAVAVMLFYALGEILQDKAVDKAKGHIRSLLDVRPHSVVVSRDDVLQKIAPEDVRVGEVVEISVGERVPLDGVLLTEDTFFNTAALTGESVPRFIRKGEEVLAGMIPLERVIRLNTVRGYSDSALSRILDMVQNAVTRKAPTERFIRKFARIYTPCVTGLAVALVSVPWLFSMLADGFVFDFDTWFYRALVLLVISCPCALVVSIPLSYFGGIGAASRIGILFKGGSFLDEMARVNTILFDKTGTLTKGVFRVQEVRPADGITVVELMSLLAGAELKSTHPVARAIVDYAGKNKIQSMPLNDVAEYAGQGILAISEEGDEIRVGRPVWLQTSGIVCPEDLMLIPETVVSASVGGHYWGCVLLADEPKEDALRMTKNLHVLGVDKLGILSGDKTELVKKLAGNLGMAYSFGDLMPEDKVSHVVGFQKDERNVVAFVGDGLNDAPVLAVSKIGIAMGGLGSDVAIETADVILQTDQPSKVVEAIRIGRQTHTVVWQNILMAIGMKLAVLLLGAFGMATLWEAVFADVGVTLLAVLNTLRLLNFKEWAVK